MKTSELDLLIPGSTIKIGRHPHSDAFGAEFMECNGINIRNPLLFKDELNELKP